MMYHARKFQITGILLGVAGAIGLPLLAWNFYQKGETGTTIAAGVCLFFAIVLALVGVYAAFAPGIQRRNAPRRACFVVTSRRLLIHPGKGTQMFSGRGGSTAVVLGSGNLGIIPYAGLELTRLSRIESKRFPGCGELAFGRDLLDRPAGGGLWALRDVRAVEKLLREKLVHPVIDKLLRGESLTREDRGEPKKRPPTSQEEGEAVAPDNNLKEHVTRGGPAGAGGPNFKDALREIEFELHKVPAELREAAMEELTAGEKLLWVGWPQGSMKGKAKGGGLLGVLAKSEDRREPEYTHYALTNRRVILWAEKSTNLASRTTVRLRFGSDLNGPVTYYPPHLVGAGVEEDQADGGSILFKLVKVVIRSQIRDQRGEVRNVTKTQMHYFGLLHVRKYLVLARLLYESLIAPCRGLLKD
jgi:hypothetical protein